jgi:hypothetical protein
VRSSCVFRSVGVKSSVGRVECEGEESVCWPRGTVYVYRGS